MVQTHSGKLYTGISTDVDRRFEEHKTMSAKHNICFGDKAAVSKVKGAKFFYFDPAVSVVYREASANRSEACKRELQIKKLNRKEKYQLAGLV